MPQICLPGDGEKEQPKRDQSQQPTKDIPNVFRHFAISLTSRRTTHDRTFLNSWYDGRVQHLFGRKFFVCLG